MSRIDAFIVGFLSIPEEEWVDPYFHLSLRQEQELYRLCSHHDLERINDGDGDYAQWGDTGKIRIINFLYHLKEIRVA